MLGIKDVLHRVQLSFFLLTKSHVAQTDCPQTHYMVKDDLELLVLQNAKIRVVHLAYGLLGSKPGPCAC